MHYNIWGWEERLHRSTGGDLRTAGPPPFSRSPIGACNSCFIYDIYFIGPVICIIIYGDGRRDCTEVRAATSEPRAHPHFHDLLLEHAIAASFTIFISLAL